MISKTNICIHFIIRILGIALCIISIALLFYRILWESLGFSVTLNRYQGISLFEQDQVKACDSEGVNLLFTES